MHMTDSLGNLHSRKGRSGNHTLHAGVSGVPVGLPCVVLRLKTSRARRAPRDTTGSESSRNARISSSTEGSSWLAKSVSASGRPSRWAIPSLRTGTAALPERESRIPAVTRVDSSAEPSARTRVRPAWWLPASQAALRSITLTTPNPATT